MNEKYIEAELARLEIELKELDARRLTTLGAISAYKSIIKSFSAEAPVAEANHDLVETVLNEVNGSSVDDDTKKKYVFDDGYTLNMSNRNKILFVIKKYNRFTHSREIAEELNRREPEMSVDEWLKKVSSALSNLKRRKRLVSYSVNDVNRDTFWGAPHWLHADGEIKEEYMYDQNMVQYSGDTIEL